MASDVLRTASHTIGAPTPAAEYPLDTTPAQQDISLHPLHPLNPTPMSKSSSFNSIRSLSSSEGGRGGSRAGSSSSSSPSLSSYSSPESVEAEELRHLVEERVYRARVALRKSGLLSPAWSSPHLNQVPKPQVPAPAAALVSASPTPARSSARVLAGAPLRLPFSPPPPVNASPGEISRRLIAHMHKENDSERCSDEDMGC